MKIKSNSLIAIALLTLFSFSNYKLSANPHQNPIHVVSLQGTVTVYDVFGQARLLRPSDTVMPGEQIITSSLSEVSLHIQEATLILQADSSLRLPNTTTERLQLNYGQIDGSYTPKKGSDKAELRIETPIGAIQVEGGQFSLSSDFNETHQELMMIASNRNAKLQVISKIESQIDYGRDYHLDLAFIPSLKESTNIPVPPRHLVILRFSQTDPQYSDHIDPARHHGPQRTSALRPSDELITPSDMSIIVVSPETALR